MLSLYNFLQYGPKLIFASYCKTDNCRKRGSNSFGRFHWSSKKTVFYVCKYLREYTNIINIFVGIYKSLRKEPHYNSISSD